MKNPKSIQKIIQFAFSRFSLFFIAILFFLVVHDIITGESSAIIFLNKYSLINY